MSFLTNNKDVNILILLKLKSVDIRNVLLVNKATSKYNNEVLWMNYWRRGPDWHFVTTCRNRCWKEFSLLVFACVPIWEQRKDITGFAKGSYYWNMCLFNAARLGYQDLVDYFAEWANMWDLGLKGAALGGHRDLVDFFIYKGAKDWDLAICYAAQGGHRDLVGFFISQGSSGWNNGMHGAASGGHRDLVEFFISQGADDWNWGLEGAEKGGHRDLEEFFRSKLDTEYRG